MRKRGGNGEGNFVPPVNRVMTIFFYKLPLSDLILREKREHLIGPIF